MKRKRDSGDLATVLRRAIDDSDLSMRQLSLRTGLPYQTIHGFVRKDRDIVLTSATKLAKLLHLALRTTRRQKG